jgi:hypothetical protein
LRRPWALQGGFEGSLILGPEGAADNSPGLSALGKQAH